MTDYVLDVSKWRCGDMGRHKLGQGNTSMLNEEGCMCCLGQFAEQAGVELERIFDMSTPSEVGRELVTGVYDPNFVQMLDSGCITDTSLANDLIVINDDVDSTYSEKIVEICKRLEEDGHTLEVINGEGNE